MDYARLNVMGKWAPDNHDPATQDAIRVLLDARKRIYYESDGHTPIRSLDARASHLTHAIDALILPRR